MMARGRSWWTAAIAASVLGGCVDSDTPIGPGSGAPGGSSNMLVQLDCVADLAAESLSCSSPVASLPSGGSALLIGGQGDQVLLESTNVNYDGTSVFSADVTVLNLLSQPIGTLDGATPASSGVRVFFLSEPMVSEGMGQVTVANPSGTTGFTASEQPYFQYDGLLGPLTRSNALTWKWNVPNTVGSFTFTVGVSAEVEGGTAEPGPRFDALGLAAGLWHTCALDRSGKAYCWGDSWGVAGGVLGTGDIAGSTLPVAVAGGLSFKAIDAGQWHACALTIEGEAWCWGLGQFGRLGNGGTANQVSPGPVAGSHRFVSIAAGLSHTCGLTRQGKAYCWGLNSEYQLGNSGASSGTPVPVEIGAKLVTIAAGENHTCALTTAGSAYCWGLGNHGQLGDGVGDIYDDLNHVSLPVEVLGGHRFIAITAGVNTSCGLRADGVALCWGDGRVGQLGDGNEVHSNVPVAVSGVTDFVTISTGGNHSCGLTKSGSAYCWGNREYGRLGDSNTSGKALTPVEVPFAGTFVSLRAFEDHTCGVSADGNAYCWGYGTFGQLGDGDTSDRAEPTLVTPGEPISF